MQVRSFSIAEVPFRLEVGDDSAAQLIFRGLSGFEADVARAHRIRVHVDERPVFVGPRAMPKLQPGVGGFLVTGEDFEAHVASDLSSAEVRSSREAFGTHSVMKLIIGEVIARAGGVMCHGVGVSHEGRAALFVGDSGAGKSTLGAWVVQGGVTRLSDELVALTPDAAGGFLAQSTPWNIGTPAVARLVAVGTIGWDARHHVQPASTAEVLRVLVANTLLPADDPASRHRVFASLQRVLAAVPTIRLFFARDPGVADVLRTELRAHARET